MKLEKNSAPILIVLGQSNAHAHDTHLPENEIVHTPMKNVYGLSREYNQAYGLDDVTWTGFTTNGMNLGETQDDTCCLANVFAKKWQDAIDDGADLPDLYVIQISVGGQGMAETVTHGGNMWYSMRTPVLIPGELGVCNISLYPLATEILALAYMNLMTSGKKPQIIGLHWNQWESECCDRNVVEKAQENFENLFWGMFTALGSNRSGDNVPLYLYRPLCETIQDSRREHINGLFEYFSRVYSDCKIIDLRDSSLFDDTPYSHGIFLPDLIHYTPEAHRYFAEYQWNKLFGAEE